MPIGRSTVFLTTPTSGTGSLWRLIGALTEKSASLTKIAEKYLSQGQIDQLAAWQPEPTDNIYLYNAPQIANPALLDPKLRLIVNFRDPRDLTCNQFYWALQHPIPGKSEPEILAFRERVRERGIEHFSLDQDNNPLFHAFRAIESRLHSGSQDVLVISYAQLCLDFDDVVDRLMTFLGIRRDQVPWERIARERTSNLSENQDWIGQVWTGADTGPGRYRSELDSDTIRALDKKYDHCLAFLRSLEQPKFRHFLATETVRQDMEMVLIGKDGQLFLTNDTNNVIQQISGECSLSMGHMFTTAAVHRARHLFGELVGGFCYAHAIVPDKEVVLRDELPETVHFEYFGPRPLKQYLDSPAGTVWRPFYDPNLLAPCQDVRYFSVTDTHWNHSGAYRYLRAFFAAALPTLSTAMDRVALQSFKSQQQGDLALKLELPPEEIEIIAPIQRSASLVFENGLQGEGAVRWYANKDSQLEQRAFILHDSCALWLLEVLSELFRETVFFHGSIFDFDFVSDLAPAFILCLQLERFFLRIPDMGGSMLQFVEAKETEKHAETRFAGFWHARHCREQTGARE